MVQPLNVAPDPSFILKGSKALAIDSKVGEELYD